MDDLPPRELFDEERYLRYFPAIANAVRDGRFSSGYDHWVKLGRFELAAGQRVAGSSFLLDSLPANRMGQHAQQLSTEVGANLEDEHQFELRSKYHGYLDRFSILNRAIVFEGWAREADIEVYYAHTRLDLSVVSVKRPDLVPVFGEEAEGWGFAACATVPTDEIDRTKLRLRLSRGIPDANIDIFGPRPDEAFTQMVSAFVADVSNKPEPSLLEIGSRARSGNVHRVWFPEKLDYVGMDIHAGPNVDIVGDAHHLSRCVNRSFDFMFSVSTFEHLLMPWKVALEMNKTLKDGGKALVISHPSWPLHEEPWDFFRFSKEAWHSLFNAHTGFRVIDAQYQYPANVVAVYSNGSAVERLSAHPTYLLSGCTVEKIGRPQVAWEAEASAVYNLAYSHA